MRRADTTTPCPDGGLNHGGRNIVNRWVPSHSCGSLAPVVWAGLDARPTSALEPGLSSAVSLPRIRKSMRRYEVGEPRA